MAAMPFVPAHRRTLFRLEATSVVATVAWGISAAVDLGMKGLPIMGMISFQPTLRLTSFATSMVAKAARMPGAGVVLGMPVQTVAL